jgi:hypothetical protein
VALNKITWEEINVMSLYGLSTLQPHYYSQMILVAEQLLTVEEREELNQMIFEVEKMVLETEVMPVKQEDGKIIWVERIRGELSLYDVEMESLADYYAFFQKEDGTIISKFDVERRLDKVRKYVYGCLRTHAEGMRFNRGR